MLKVYCSFKAVNSIYYLRLHYHQSKYLTAAMTVSLITVDKNSGYILGTIHRMVKTHHKLLAHI